MKNEKTLLVKPGSKVALKNIDPSFSGKHKNKKSIATEIQKLDEKLRSYQYMIYSEGKRSLLICLQALDGAGKDGTINHVLGSMNPQGTRVHGFKAPTPEEKKHDFLWRIKKQVPTPGEVVIFNRSHYEDVLVVRVHDLVPKDVWEKRYDQINEFEKELHENGTTILKFFLYISPEEQLKRFKLRLDDPLRHWKISETDYTERKFWNSYIRAYEDALSKTSTDYAPWYIIPSNHKWFRNLAVAEIVADTMKGMDLQLPEAKVNIDEIKKKYHQAEKSEVKKIGKKKWKKLESKEKKKLNKTDKPSQAKKESEGDG
jgi:PPK2 family polyphosphate:nucleotide phosphotransferase